MRKADAPPGSGGQNNIKGASGRRFRRPFLSSRVRFDAAAHSTSSLSANILLVREAVSILCGGRPASPIARMHKLCDNTKNELQLHWGEGREGGNRNCFEWRRNQTALTFWTESAGAALDAADEVRGDRSIRRMPLRPPSGRSRDKTAGQPAGQIRLLEGN